MRVVREAGTGSLRWLRNLLGAEKAGAPSVTPDGPVGGRESRGLWHGSP